MAISHIVSNTPIHDLCNNCSELGDAIGTGFPWPQPTVRLMTVYLDDIASNPSCAFCRLVTAAVSQAWTTLPLIDSNGQRMMFQIDYSALFRDNPDMGIGFRMLGSIAYSGPNPPRRLYEPRIRLLVDDHTSMPPGRDGMAFGRRVQSDDCTTDLVSEWYLSCMRYHGSFCDMPRNKAPNSSTTSGVDLPESASSEGSVPRMLLIDVHRMCVVTAPAACRYLALSYIWGPKPFLKLLTENFDHFRCDASLDRPDLPRTIRDAITLTRLLGERHLWVDALCIVQDDTETKMIQIQAMDRIYARATLTIVAAGGEDVHAGLPGLTPNSRSPTEQNIEIISGHKFVAMSPPLVDLLESTRWQGRGWTYQEYMLSKRLLIFAPSQVFFHCRLQSCAEDHHRLWSTGSPPIIPPPLPGATNTSHHPLYAVDQRHQIDQRRQFAYLENYWAYYKLVEDFSRRSLSYEADAISSVVGILKAMSEFRPDKYICGLPANLLEWALMWTPSGNLRRRGPTAASRAFPSWSWIGWVGAVQMADMMPHTLTLTIKDWKFFAHEIKPPTGITSKTPNAQSPNPKERRLFKKLSKIILNKAKEAVAVAQSKAVEHMVLRLPNDASGLLPYHPSVKVTLSNIPYTMWRTYDDIMNVATTEFLGRLYSHQQQIDALEPMIESGALRFSSAYTHFELGVGTPDPTRGFVSADVCIFKFLQNGIWVGSLWLDRPPGQRGEDMAHKMVEVVFLSRTTAGAGMRTLDINLQPSATWDVNHLGPARPRDADFFLANVMWIRWVDKERRIAERVGVGHIHGTAWFAAEPQRGEFILV